MSDSTTTIRSLCPLCDVQVPSLRIEEGKILKKYILATNTATREALINYPDYNQIVDNSKDGIERAIKFAIENEREIQKLNNQYIYDNDKIINKIVKIIEENKKHPDRIGKNIG